jgi:4'-phosphopantetheinyl transferase
VIDLWLEDLSLSNADYQHYWQLLDDHEQTKASRFFQEQHRRQYVASHGKLRTILATYTNISPAQLVFAITEFGKPYLILNSKAHTVTFNLSHSNNKMLLAIGYQCEIGIDIEAWNPKIDRNAIVKHCFADSEKAFWQHTPEQQKDSVFYQFWTRKESFIKAVGAGMNINVAQVISSGQGKAHFLSIPRNYGKPEDWQVIDLPLSNGLSAALTVKNYDYVFRWRQNNDFDATKIYPSRNSTTRA